MHFTMVFQGMLSIKEIKKEREERSKKLKKLKKDENLLEKKKG